MKSKFTSIFTSLAVKCVTDKEKDELLSLASLEQLKKFLPEDASANDGFLPIAFNAFTPNRINKNDDVIDTKTALAIYKKFKNTPINIEHKRGNVIGVILSAGFSEFGSDKPLTEEDIKDYKKPFNVTLGGLIWKVVNSELAELIQDSNDPTSPNYMSVSASWELGFSGYNLLLLDKGQKNIDGGKIIADGAEIEKYKEKLRALGGEGVLDEKRLYRMPSEDVEPLGIGLTEKPAGDVKGIATETPKKEDIKAEDICASIHFQNICSCGTVISQCRCNSEARIIKTVENGCPTCIAKISEDKEKQNKISHLTNAHVKQDTIMKIKSISDITDENLKECLAANVAVGSTIADVISNHVKEKSLEWEKEKKALDTKVSDTSALAVKVQEDLNKVNEQLKKATDSIATFEKEKKDREAVDKFNERMSLIANDYELDEDLSKIVAEEVKAIETDEVFAKYQKKAEALFKPFKKGAKVGKDGKPIKADPDGDADAKKAKAALDAKAALEAALENGTKEKGGLPNTTEAGDKSMRAKFAAAFARDQFVITK